MIAKVKDATKVTMESWRPKFYGLYEEGRKFRVNSIYIKSAVITGSALLFVCQIYSALQPSFKKKEVALFAPPQVVHDALNSTYVPPMMDRAREAELEKAKTKEQKDRARIPIVIERIRAVSLDEVKGIPAGSQVLARLVSGGANGLVKAELTQNLTSSGETLLPSGTVILGKASSSDDRLYIKFRRAIQKAKPELKIKAEAYDAKDMILGMKGKKISDAAFKLAASAGLIFLGGVADGMRDDYSSSVFTPRKPTMRDAALNGVSTATSNLSRETLESMRNSKERVEVEHSTMLIVIFGDSDGEN